MPGGWSQDDEPADEAARRSSENVTRQLAHVVSLIREAVKAPASFRITLELICELNLLAVDGVEPSAGQLRTKDIEIVGSRHVPPPADQIPGLIDDLCKSANAPASDPLVSAAYVLWRLNWIHPFAEGNGRTARAVAYLVLSVQFGRELPGETTLVERMAQRKRDYWHALEAADRAYVAGTTDVSALIDLLAELLAAQIGA